MEKVNVLFVMLQMKMGGTERLIHNLALKLDRTLFNPSVAWFFGNEILKEFNDLNIPLYYVPKVKRIDFSAMQKLADIIKDNDIHIVNAHHFMSMVYSFYGSKIKNHSPLVYTEHSEWDIEQISWKWRKIGPYLLHRADAAVGVTPAVANRIKNTFKTDDSKTFAIPNGVDLAAFNNHGDKKQALRKELGLADNDNVIGTVANFRKIKNHIFLLRAFHKLVKGNKKVKLLLIGQGFERDPENSEQEIRDFIKEKGLARNVLLLGFRSDILELLSVMDIFCLTSFKEGLPISLIEAMAAGLPLVGTDVAGIKDTIIPDKNGFLVPTGDVTGLKNSLLTLLNDESLRHSMGQESKSLARNTYSLDSCIKKYEDLFLSSFNSDPIQQIRKIGNYEVDS